MDINQMRKESNDQMAKTLAIMGTGVASLAKYVTGFPANFLKNRNCPKCSKREKLTKDNFIKRARSIHGDKYDYSQVEVHGVDSKVTIICPIHGPFEQTPYKHIQRQQGCPVCGNLQKGIS